ncbi:MAG TPA: hypothetical protein VGJ21_15750 [Terracidiphilus sp.]|jgi:hypothetical protein
MRSSRNRSAWIWVAFTAIALASVAQAEAGLQSARGYAGPVLQFLAGSHASQAPATPGSPRVAQHRNQRQARVASQPHVSGTVLAMLPVFFVGLVAPLNEISPRSVVCLGGAPSTPLLPSSFQRPPPVILL